MIADRRQAQKVARRRAIMDAALALATERGRAGFTVEELAERAEVSRRTIFNHFATVNDVTIAAFTAALDILVANFIAATESAPVGDDTRAAMFAELVDAIAATDLVVPMRQMTRILGAVDDCDPRQWTMIQEVLGRTRDHMSAEMASRHPGADRIDIDLLVASLISGVNVIARHWVDRFADADDSASRLAWSTMLDHMIATIRDGYVPHAPLSRPLTTPECASTAPGAATTKE